MKKVLIYAGALVMLGSCTKDIASYNTQTKRPENVPAATLFSNGTRNLIDGITSPNVNTNVFRFTVQHWAMTTYQDEVNYDFTTRAINTAWWTRLYRDVLADLNEAARLVEADNTLSANTKANQLAMIDIMEVYSYEVLVTTFGNVPYSQALKGDITFPVYDDAKTIYNDLLARLTADIAKLSTTAAGLPASQDLIGQGSVAKWQKFANSLMVRMAMLIADSDPTKAKSLFEAAEAKAINSNAENIKFAYLKDPPNTNPVWVDVVQSGRQDYVAATTLLNFLKDKSDPRLTLFFRPNNNGEYVGGIVGSNNTFSSVAKPSDQVAASDAPATLFSYAEMEFYRAEAKERNWTVSGTAAEHYNNGVTASIVEWGGTAADAATYLARPDVAYATAAGDWKQKIGTQLWIALYNRPYEGWTEIRRLNYPVLPAPTGAKSGFPVRLVYPNTEQTLNGANYTSAASAIGGDKYETKLFFDK